MDIPVAANASGNDENPIEAGVQVLRCSGTVAFPTDTVYGLGADATSPAAVQRVIDIKGRSAEMGLPVLLADPEDLEQVVQLRAGEVIVKKLASLFWPGPLTLVVPRSALIPDVITGGRDTVAVRVPDHPIPRELARRLGRPITGTSANRSGQPPSATAQDVRRQLGAAVDLVLDGGPPVGGVESTILDVSGAVPRLLRRGAISEQAIQACLAELGKPMAVA